MCFGRKLQIKNICGLGFRYYFVDNGVLVVL